MAGNQIKVKLVGLEEFTEQCKEVSKQIESLKESIMSMPWYVRVILAIRGFSLKNIPKIDVE